MQGLQDGASQAGVNFLYMGRSSLWKNYVRNVDLPGGAQAKRGARSSNPIAATQNAIGLNFESSCSTLPPALTPPDRGAGEKGRYPLFYERVAPPLPRKALCSMSVVGRRINIAHHCLDSWHPTPPFPPSRPSVWSCARGARRTCRRSPRSMPTRGSRSFCRSAWSGPRAMPWPSASPRISGSTAAACGRWRCGAGRPSSASPASRCRVSRRTSRPAWRSAGGWRSRIGAGLRHRGGAAGARPRLRTARARRDRVVHGPREPPLARGHGTAFHAARSGRRLPPPRPARGPSAAAACSLPSRSADLCRGAIGPGVWRRGLGAVEKQVNRFAWL